MSELSPAKQDLAPSTLTVTVGIPAYNEAANIGRTLAALRNQAEHGFVIREIQVVSDGSSDDTEAIVRSCTAIDPRIVLRADGARRGKPERMNEIIHEATTDILVILDADIMITGDQLLVNLLEPLLHDEVVVHTSGHALPLPPETWVEKIANAGVLVWEKAHHHKGASSLYHSEGRIRAFRRAMYTTLHFPCASADEAYSFLFGEQRHYPFVAAEKALVRYRLPSTLHDYFRQMMRFLKSESIQHEAFDPVFVRPYYNIGLKEKIRALLTAWWEMPFWTTLYILILPFPRFYKWLRPERKQAEGIWTSISSTKALREESASQPHIVFSNYDDRNNPWYAGGGARVIHDVARRLVGAYRVTVFTGTYPRAKRCERIDGVEYRRIGLACCGPWIGQLAYWIALPFRAKRLDFTLWFESFTPPFGVSFLPLMTRRPVVGLIHMLPGRDMWRKYHLPFFLFERLGLKWYREFVVLSSCMEKVIRRSNHTAKIHTIPNGIDIPAPEPHEKKHLLFMGRIEVDQKGLDLLLAAYEKLSSEVRLPLLIAGAGVESEMEQLRMRVAASPYREHIELVGRVEGEAKDRLYRSAAAVIVPSRFETFSLTALEALSYGIPAVGFDIDGLSAFTGGGVFKAVPFEVSSLQTEIERAILDTRDAAFFQNQVIKYEWDSILADYRKLIQRSI